MESKRGEAPLFNFLPLALIGEGDTGGEVDSTGGLFDSPSLIAYTGFDIGGV